MSLDSLCRWQVQVSVYCAWRIPAHLRCTQCSILLHLMDICFLTCICLWQISQIQTFLFGVVGPRLVSTSPSFVSNSASHPVCPHGRHTQKTVNRAPIPLVTWSVVNVTAEVNDFGLISLDTNRVSREEVCLPSFEVMNCRLK